MSPEDIRNLTLSEVLDSLDERYDQMYEADYSREELNVVEEIMETINGMMTD